MEVRNKKLRKMHNQDETEELSAHNLALQKRDQITEETTHVLGQEIATRKIKVTDKDKDKAKKDKCKKCLKEIIRGVASRLDTKPHSEASAWILEECDTNDNVLTDPCDQGQTFFIEQRYALAVMYFSLGGDDWGLTSGEWISEMNHCDWLMVNCDSFPNGNVIEINSDYLRGK